jgi:signal transduction histidine kinase
MIAVASGLLMVAALVTVSLLISPIDTEADDFIPSQITVVTLVGVVLIPLRPLQTFAFGVSTGLIYLVATTVVADWHYPAKTPDPRHWVFIIILTLLATGLTMVVYSQRSDRWFAHRNEVAAAEELRSVEKRMLLSEHAASMGRLAAAISHELNSPIGALVSGVDTLLLLGSRQAASPPQEQARLVLLQSELRRSVKASASRLQELVSRMQRFTNLDKADVQQINLNTMLNDVAALLEPQWKTKANVTLDLEEVPLLTCRPQQLGAVFYTLVANAIDAVNGDGRITISSRRRDDLIEVLIADNGRGMTAEVLGGIFDPGFRSKGDRVAAANWSMFSARQIIREHGGDIHVSSGVGKGTTVSVTLPSAGVHP